MEKAVETQIIEKIKSAEKAVGKKVPTKKQSRVKFGGMNHITFWPVSLRIEQEAKPSVEEELFSMIIILLSMDTKNEIQSFT
jgi:hypothetical protein